MERADWWVGTKSLGGGSRIVTGVYGSIPSTGKSSLDRHDD